MRRSDQPGATWRNWAGNETARPRRTALPRSADEVADEVRKAAADGLTVRMAGTGHSFTPVAATDGVLLYPGGMTSIRSVDAAAGLVTVEAGCPLRVLNASLQARGLSLANMGDIQAQTVAGAIQTGTHGTGRDIGGMAAQVAGLEMVLADGTVVSCSADSPGDGLFDAARVGLGALGVVTAVTFRVVPAFLLEAREQPMRWSEVISRLDELTSANEHFEFYWFPHTEGCLTKRNNSSPGPPRPLPAFRYLLDDELLSNTLFGVTCRLGHAFPAAI
jgi:FAD/FMN-containing dehydrogenase